ncbi:hypothetical protein [Actinospica robiniae]|uniref:hypothetical protein n=1 Tax=Actinospica robiniae TaxID=304901 RepID=UPI0003FF4F67|nr:hypothetical protein [Actinospica robiniae]
MPSKTVIHPVQELAEAAGVATLVVDPVRIAEHEGRPTVFQPAMVSRHGPTRLSDPGRHCAEVVKKCHR